MSTVTVASIAPHFFWITSRAAGTAALLLSSLAVCVGLTMGGRMTKGKGPDLRVTHEALSLATMVALVVHAVSLLGDGFMHPSVAGITVPFASSFQAPWLGLGIIAGWATLALGLSYYARARIGVRRWRTLHRFTALAWILGLVHSLGEGTDAGAAWFLVATGVVAIPALALLVVRMSARPAAPAPSGPVPREPAPPLPPRCRPAGSPRLLGPESR